MTTFAFATDAADHAFLEDVLRLVQALGGKSWSEAHLMLHQYWASTSDFSDSAVHSETPYYWAMCILHHPTIGDDQPEWYLDARFMPPPEPIRSQYYSHRPPDAA